MQDMFNLRVVESPEAALGFPAANPDLFPSGRSRTQEDQGELATKAAAAAAAVAAARADGPCCWHRAARQQSGSMAGPLPAAARQLAPSSTGRTHPQQGSGASIHRGVLVGGAPSPRQRPPMSVVPQQQQQQQQHVSRGGGSGGGMSLLTPRGETGAAVPSFAAAAAAAAVASLDSEADAMEIEEEEDMALRPPSAAPKASGAGTPSEEEDKGLLPRMAGIFAHGEHNLRAVLLAFYPPCPWPAFCCPAYLPLTCILLPGLPAPGLHFAARPTCP